MKRYDYKPHKMFEYKLGFRYGLAAYIYVYGRIINFVLYFLLMFT